MSLQALEERLAALETKVERLVEKSSPEATTAEKPWWEQIRGQFKDDPLYDEAMRLGREWRESENVIDESDEDKC